MKKVVVAVVLALSLSGCANPPRVRNISPYDVIQRPEIILFIPPIALIEAISDARNAAIASEKADRIAKAMAEREKNLEAFFAAQKWLPEEQEWFGPDFDVWWVYGEGRGG